jgi:hypothetical protein
MINLVEQTLESLLSLEEVLLQEKTEKPKEILQMTTELGKLQRRPQRSMLSKKDRYLKRQEKSSKDIKGLHQRNNQKSKNMACLRHLISLRHQHKEKR